MDEEIIEEFITESRESIEEVEPVVVALDGEADAEDLALIFRCFHSFKGTASFIGLAQTSHLAHVAESLLDLMRKGLCVIRKQHVDVLCKTLDVFRAILDEIETNKSDEGQAGAVGILSDELAALIKEVSGAQSAYSKRKAPPRSDARANPSTESSAEGNPSHSTPEPADKHETPWALDRQSVPQDTPGPGEQAAKPEESIALGPLAEAKQGDVVSETPEQASPDLDDLPPIDMTADVDLDVPMDIEISEELLVRFVAESEEHLSTLEQTLVALENEHADGEQLGEAFRAVHSFKGNAAICGFNDMSELTHLAETVFGELQSGKRQATAPVISLLLELLDAVRAVLATLPGGDGHIPDVVGWQQRLTHIDEGNGAAAQMGQGSPNVASLRPARSTPNQPLADLSLNAAKAAAAPEAAPPIMTQVSAAVLPEPPQNATKSVPASASPTGKAADDGGGGGGEKRTVKSATSIRVDTAKLDELMNLVGELIIAETTVTRNPDLDGYEFENFQKAAVNLNRITRSLQDIAMQVRMIPIATTFRKMIRLVRDVSAKQGKHVELFTTGEETEVDKTVIESISDPLVHIIRNAVDHGIEDNDARKAANKKAHGKVKLEARHQGGEVWIIVQDDGKGMDPDMLLKKAIEKGVADPDRKYTRSECFDFIFAAGFSTAETVTDISGRGVGMDVVRRNIEAVGGRVEVSSKLGQGTTFTMRIPLTLAIIEGMLVRVGGAFYTIPLLSIRESVKPERKDILVTSDGYEMLKLRNRHYPIVRLQRIHDVKGGETDLFAGTLVILEAGDKVSCVLVDEVLGQCQTVIKPLPDYLKRVSGLSGCSILHNGEISLILDVDGVVDATQDKAA